MLDVLRTYGVKLQANVIPTGLQAGSFTESNGLQFKQKYQIENKRPMLLYVGRVAFEKNIPFLFEMVKVLAERHPNVLLVVAGEGPAEKSLHQLAITLKIEDNVKFIGYLDRETELNACYKAADVFVFSSKSETQGLVLLEAMAQGTPVVAIAELGTASILVEGQGAMIAPESTDAFSEKVAVLIEDHAKRDLLSQTAKSHALTVWSAKAQAERLGRFYQKTIEQYNSNKSSLPSMTLIDQ